jgi:hypothetical protein
LTAEAGFQSQVNPYGIYGGKSSSGTGVSASTLVLSVSIVLVPRDGSLMSPTLYKLSR